MDDKPLVVWCVECGRAVRVPRYGVLPQYCGSTCRQRAFRRRVKGLDTLPPSYNMGAPVTVDSSGGQDDNGNG